MGRECEDDVRCVKTARHGTAHRKEFSLASADAQISVGQTRGSALGTLWQAQRGMHQRGVEGSTCARRWDPVPENCRSVGPLPRFPVRRTHEDVPPSCSELSTEVVPCRRRDEPDDET